MRIGVLPRRPLAKAGARVVERRGNLPEHIEVTQSVWHPAAKGLLEWDCRQAGKPGWAWVRIGLSMEKQNAHLLAYRPRVLLVALLAMCVVLWLQYTQLRRLLRPLGRLIDFTRRVAAGDLSQRAPLGAWNEVDDLTRGFQRHGGASWKPRAASCCRWWIKRRKPAA